MKYSTTADGGFRPTAGKICAACLLASLVGGLAMQPALADNHGYHGHEQRGGYGYGHGRGYYGHRDWRGNAYYAPYPVYAPPPVYYPPQPSSGISLFFPIRIR